MMKKLIVTILTTATLIVPALAAEPIEGLWKRPSTGTIIKFSPCGGNFCGIVQTGEFTGQSIGKMTGSGKNYTGSLTDLEKKKTYNGKALVTGNKMKLSGCVAFNLVCIGESWDRQ